MKPIFPESPQDWTNAKPGKIYFNSNERRYTSTILAEEQVIADDNLLETSRKYFPDFVENVLLNLNKQIEEVPSLANSVSLDNNFIDPSPLIKQKLLVSISEDSLKEIPERPDVDISQYRTLRYSLSGFFTKVTNVAKKFLDYQADMVADIYHKSNSNFSNVDFMMESEALYAISSNISSLIESNNADISSYTEIEISYGDDFSIQCIKLVGGLDSQNLKFIFEEFKKGYPQNRQQTTLFLYNLPQLNEEIKSNFVTYEDIINNYMAQFSKRESNTNEISSRASQKGRSFSVKNKDVTNKFDSLENIGIKSAELLQREILNSVYRTPCMTPEERDRINAQLEAQTQKRANLANRLSLSVSDTFFTNLPEVLQRVADKQGKEALNDLGTNLLNRLGVCGIGDLTSLTLNTVFAYLDEQEYADELASCAVQNLNNDKVQKLWEGLQRFNKNTEILERYQKFVGDTIPPWNTAGYVPPNYRKDLNSDDPISEKYTLKIKTSQEDTDIDFRFTAFKNSVAATVRGEELLDLLVNAFPDEMGWLSFFTEMTKGILNKCKVPLPNVGVSFEANWCQKRVNLPELEDVQRTNASFTFKPSTIGTILVEELKNVIINLTVRTIISSMRQVFQIIAAGTSFDSDYFKKDQYIPDLFQSDNDIQRRIAEYCSDPSNNYRKTNEAAREVIYEKSSSSATAGELSLEDIDAFLKSSSVALTRYDKLRLYMGQAEETTYEKVLSMVSGSPMSNYLRNYGDVEQVFLGIGKLLDVQSYEAGFYESVRQPAPFTLEYCGEGDDLLSEGYFQNKPDITPEQVERMKQVLKDVQRDKICSAVDALGNPNGVIIGQLGEMFRSKTGPIFSRISEELAELYGPVIEKKMEAISKNYRNDLYNSRGLFDLIMVNDAGIGQNRRDLANFFAPSADSSASIDPQSMQLTRAEGSNYSPFSSSANILLNFKKGFASYSDPSTPPGPLDKGSEKIKSLLIKNQAILRDSLNEKVSDNFITKGALAEIVNSYFDDMLNKLSSRTYGGWPAIYSKIQEGQGEDTDYYISQIISQPNVTERAKEFYKLLDSFDEDYKYAPFNALKSREEASLFYAMFSMLVNTVSSEVLLKNLPIYEAFGADLLKEYDFLGGYIYDKVMATIDKYSGDRKEIKVLEKLVQTAIMASNEGIIPPFNQELSENIDNINDNIKNWIRGDRGDKVKNLEKNRKDMDAIAKFFIRESSFKYIKEFQESMSEVEGKTLPSINKTNTIYNYIFNESLLSSAKDVIANPDQAGKLNKGLRLEKYILLEGAKSGLPSGVQNLSDFRNYLKTNLSISGNISENWSKWSFGIRISSVYDFAQAGILENEISLDLRNQIKGFTLIQDSDFEDSKKYFLSPLVVYNKEIADQPVSPTIIDDYDETSMKKELSEISDFLNFYYRGMNIENLMSLATIYIDEEFGTFLYNEASSPVLPTTVDNWFFGGQKLLNETKRFIVNNLERI